MDHHAFSVEIQQLCHAFGRTIDMQTIWEYYKALEDLNEPQVKQLFQWAIENIETGFPRIATLKQYARAQGWYRTNSVKSGPDIFVYVICPRCEARFVVMRRQLEQDARAGRSYRCINYDHSRCNVVFSATEIFAEG